jgi:kumamolisin
VTGKGVTADAGAGRPVPRPGPEGFSAWELTRHYRFPEELDGSGVSVALVRLYGGFRRSDIEQYFAAAGRPAPVIELVSLGGQANNPVADPPANTGLVRDLEILGTAAPGARITVYFAGNTEDGVVDGLSSAIHDPERDNSVICLTWEIPEADVDPMLAGAVHAYIQDAVLMGKAVCAPAGSWTAGGLVPCYPGTEQFVLSCGATRAIASSGGEFVERPVPGGQAAPAASQRQARPQWQARAGGRAWRRIRGRLVPDVTCLADDDHGYRCFVNGSWAAVPGAGAAVCLWAGLLARIVQANGRPGVTVPLLYQRLGPRGALAPAGPGSSRGSWSPGTGWGSPDGQRLLAALPARR